MWGWTGSCVSQLGTAVLGKHRLYISVFFYINITNFFKIKPLGKSKEKLKAESRANGRNCCGPSVHLLCINCFHTALTLPSLELPEQAEPQ